MSDAGRSTTIERESHTCSLDQQEMKDRRALARRTLVPHITGWRQAERTLRISFDGPSARGAVEQFVALERGCCGSLEFRISEPSNPLSLTIEAPGGAASTLALFVDALAAIEGPAQGGCACG